MTDDDLVMEAKPPTTRDIERRLLEKRVEVLERRTTRLLVVLAVAMIAFAAVLGWGWYELSPKRIIVAEEFRLEDPSRRARAWLTLQDGSPSLKFFDNEYKSRLEIRIQPAGVPYLEMSDASGKPRLILNVDENGPRIAMQDAQEGDKLLMRINRDRPSLSFNDSLGRERAEFFLDQTGPGMSFKTGLGKTLLEMYGLSSGPVILMKDEQGNHIWTAPH